MTIFVIQAYEATDNQGRLTNVVTLELKARSVDEALKKAAKYVSKPQYRVSQIIEK